jgi:tRNA-specific 2-thiouridylase
MAKKVVVGMSGGVDSSVAAYLLKKQGYEVIGVTMEMWRDEPDVCEDGIEAKRIADQLGIQHVIMHFKPEFDEHVIGKFIEEYTLGRTPNPCVMCNRCIKWQALMERAKELGADYVATGHYAKIEKLENGRLAVRNSEAASKDQTYVLCQLTQEQLAHTILPLGDFSSKDEVRRIASELGLLSADKKDSQDICFISDGDYAKFLVEHGVEEKPGNFVDKDGNVLGRHKGIIHYTVGQRKGLGIAFGKPMFVIRIDAEKNEVVLGENEDLFTTEVYFNDANNISDEEFVPGKMYQGKVRYSSRTTNCTVEKISDDEYKAVFCEPVRAATPGQSIVLYDGEYVAGGGTIFTKI